MDLRGGTSTVMMRAKQLMWISLVAVVALLGGLVGGILIFPLALVTPSFIVLPLTLGFAALLSAIGASWVGTLLAPDGTRSRLLVVVAVSEAAAGASAIALIGGALLVLAGARWAESFLGPPIVLLGLIVLVVALGASWATWRFRGPGAHLGRDATITLAVAAVVLILGLSGLASVTVGSLGLPGIGGMHPIYGVFVSMAATIASMMLLARRFRGPDDQPGRDAAITLGLVGLPAPVVLGVYYLAAMAGLTTG